jgi:hypothetical protein
MGVLVPRSPADTSISLTTTLKLQTKKVYIKVLLFWRSAKNLMGIDVGGYGVEHTMFLSQFIFGKTLLGMI